MSEDLIRIFYCIQEYSDYQNEHIDKLIANFLSLFTLVPQFNKIVNISTVTTIKYFLHLLPHFVETVKCVHPPFPSMAFDYQQQLINCFKEFSEITGNDFIRIYRAYLDTRVCVLNAHQLEVLREQLSSPGNYAHWAKDLKTLVDYSYPSYSTFVALCDGGQFASCYLWDKWRRWQERYREICGSYDKNSRQTEWHKQPCVKYHI